MAFIVMLKQQANDNDDDIGNQIQKLLTDFGSVQFASLRAAELIMQAQQALLVLPESPARKLLHEMAQAVLTRQF